MLENENNEDNGPRGTSPLTDEEYLKRLSDEDLLCLIEKDYTINNDLCIREIQNRLSEGGIVQLIDRPFAHEYILSEVPDSKIEFLNFMLNLGFDISGDKMALSSVDLLNRILDRFPARSADHYLSVVQYDKFRKSISLLIENNIINAINLKEFVNTIKDQHYCYGKTQHIIEILIEHIDWIPIVMPVIHHLLRFSSPLAENLINLLFNMFAEDISDYPALLERIMTSALDDVDIFQLCVQYGFTQFQLKGQHITNSVVSLMFDYGIDIPFHCLVRDSGTITKLLEAGIPKRRIIDTLVSNDYLCEFNVYQILMDDENEYQFWEKHQSHNSIVLSCLATKGYVSEELLRKAIPCYFLRLIGNGTITAQWYIDSYRPALKVHIIESLLRIDPDLTFPEGYKAKQAHLTCGEEESWIRLEKEKNIKITYKSILRKKDRLYIVRKDQLEFYLDHTDLISVEEIFLHLVYFAFFNKLTPKICRVLSEKLDPAYVAKAIAVTVI